MVYSLWELCMYLKDFSSTVNIFKWKVCNYNHWLHLQEAREYKLMNNLDGPSGRNLFLSF